MLVEPSPPPAPRAARRRLWTSEGFAVLALFLLFFLFGSVLAFQSLSYDWFSDDLHLVRTFSPSELASVFTGTFDVDGIETPGYRPLFTVFDHLRAWAFGESVVAHRLFGIALFAAYLSALAFVAQRIGTPYWQGAIAGIVTLSSPFSWSKLVWITDAIHTVTGLLVVLAAALLLSSLSRAVLWKLAISLVLATLALLSREDALAFYPLLPAFAVAYTLKEAARGSRAGAATSVFDGLPRESRRPGALGPPGTLQARTIPGTTPSATAAMIPAWPPQAWSNISALIWSTPTAFRLKMIGAYTLALLLITVAVFVVRAVLISNVPSTILIEGWIKLLPYVFFPLGPGEHTILWVGALVAVLAILRFAVPISARWEALFWLGAALVSTAPALVVARPNLLLYPTSLFGYFLARTLGEFGRRSLVSSIVSALMLVPLIGVSASLNVRSQESLHTMSADYLEGNAQFLWGQFSRATIPDVRRASLLQQFAELGIHSREEYERRFPLIREEAVREGRDRPNAAGKVFVPRISWSSFVERTEGRRQAPGP
ncbi:MAG: hypothetical protein GEU73_13525 [Chloroflexi bacterium]|nr:hypothetical protein [Chloroflexota bacterium]